MMHCLPPGIDNMSILGIASFPFLEPTPFPISSVRYCWQLLPWEMRNDKGNIKSISFGLCLKLGIVIYIGIEWVELTTWVRIKTSVCKCTGMIVGMVQSLAWCDIGRKGGTHGWAVYSQVGVTTVFTQHPTNQHVKICKYTQTNLH